MADTSDKELPKRTAVGVGSSITAESDKTLPEITASGVGLSANVDSDKSLPKITAVGVGASTSATSDKSLPKITAVGTGSSSSATSDVSLPVIVAEGAGETSRTGDSDATVPMRTAVGVARTDTIGTSILTVSLVQALGVAETEGIAVSDQTLPFITAVGRAITNRLATSEQTLPSIQAYGFAYEIQIGQVVTPENPYNEPQEAWVMNYETNAPYRYYRFPANSMCRFKGKTYVANIAGIYEVTGDTDAGQQIHSQVTLPKSDFGSSKDKRMPYVYVGARSRGRMQLKVVANSQAGRYYALNVGSDNMHGSRVDVGKGLEARYWQLAVANLDGAAFSLDSLEIPPVVLNRRGV
jgi:hypothetical protein